jgi:hypothetical protein
MTSSGIEPPTFRLVAYWYTTVRCWLIIFKLANTSFFYDDPFGRNKGGGGGTERMIFTCTAMSDFVTASIRAW